MRTLIVALVAVFSGGNPAHAQSTAALYGLVESRYGGDDKTSVLGLGFQHDLSKRRTPYTALTRSQNDSTGDASNLRGSYSVLPAGLTTAGSANVVETTAVLRHVSSKADWQGHSE